MIEWFETVAEALRALPDTWSHPAKLHAALVHLPIGGAILAALLVAAAWVKAGKSAGLRWAILLVVVASIGASWVAASTGEEVEARLLGTPTGAEFAADIDEHHHISSKVWFTFAAIGAGTLLTFAKAAGLRVLGQSFATAGVVACLVVVAAAGQTGGALVHDRGLTAARVKAVEAAGPATVDDAAEPEAAAESPPVEQPPLE